MPKKKAASFEQSLQELEALVQKMDAGELDLEQSLQAFEQGIGLIRDCQQSLSTAEQKVKQLMENQGNLEAVDFNPENNA